LSPPANTCTPLSPDKTFVLPPPGKTPAVAVEDAVAAG
jgi:hypothetical protein